MSETKLYSSFPRIQFSIKVSVLLADLTEILVVLDFFYIHEAILLCKFLAHESNCDIETLLVDFILNSLSTNPTKWSNTQTSRWLFLWGWRLAVKKKKVIFEWVS